MSEQKSDPIGISLLAAIFILSGIIGFIYYKSIDWDVLKRLEKTPLVLPTPVLLSNTTPTTNISTPTSNQTKK